jgi:hypothetical protein
MNSNLIAKETEGKSLVEYLASLAVEVRLEETNAKLIKLASKVYNGRLSSEQITKMCAMSYDDKLWLIAQYEEEVEYNTPPNFDHLY